MSNNNKTKKDNQTKHVYQIHKIDIPNVEIFNDELWKSASKKVQNYRNDLKSQYNIITDFLADDYINNIDTEATDILLVFEYTYSLFDEIFENELSDDQIEEIRDCLDLIDYFYEKVMMAVSISINEKHSEISERINRQQGVQFTTFSIFLTILSFVLSNVILISKVPDTKTIILCNMSILLFSTILFNFIANFLGVPNIKEKFAILIIKRIVLLLIPILLLIAIVIVSLVKF